MISIVGFSDASNGPVEGQTPQAPTKHRRKVHRQVSLLSESLKSANSFHSHSHGSRSSWDSLSTASSLEEPWSEAESDICCQTDLEESCGITAPVLINYSKAAKARIEAAEAQGRAREEQLELLQAVRAYMAQSKALHASKRV